MSLKGLADETGITYSVIYDFATMKRQSAQWSVIEAICRTLKIQPGDFLEYVPDWGTE
jgi:DNA-binding Xre family transcriptional regulator